VPGGWLAGLAHNVYIHFMTSTQSPRSVFPRPAPDGKEDCICFLLRSAARRASALYTRHLKKIGLGLPQHSLIGMAAAFEKQNGRPATISELAQALDLDRTTMARNLKPMVQAGYVSIEKASDCGNGRGFGQGGRAKAVRATREGRMAYRAGVALWRQAQDEMIAGLAAEYPALMAGLAAAIAAIPAASPGDAANDA
jgi:DNA-binding MarR family transcriptional regulator